MGTNSQGEILVAGGGLAGLIATALLARLGFAVRCIDPGFGPEGSGNGEDLRSTAFLNPAIATLERAGLWRHLAPISAPLRTMRILDAGGAVEEIRQQADFRADEIGAGGFGANLPNAPMRRILLDHLSSLPNVVLQPAGFASLVPRMDRLHVRLDDGSRVEPALLIAADGRGSAVRRALGIEVRRVSYGQKALVFTVSCSAPHEGVSTEIHRTGGPFTLVPLPERDGAVQMAVVWMVDAAEADRLAGLDEAEFNAALNTRSCGAQGDLGLVGPRARWPIVSQLATSLTGPRSILIAEAAHVMPPIGAQGLNTSLHDIDMLADLIAGLQASGQDIGDPGRLAEFGSRRMRDVSLRMAGIDLLNRAAQVEAQPLRDLRLAGLRLLHGIKPLRLAAMRAGLGGNAGRRVSR